MSQPVNVLLHVQHLLGTGHQRRAAAVAKRLASRGAVVTYASGGMPVPGLDIGGARMEQLPAARASDASYRALVDESGRVVDETWRQRRVGRLLQVLEEARPDVVVIETFPFGRGLLRFELLPLVEQIARGLPRPRVLCSIRDIVEPRDDPGKYAEMSARAERYFDRILVHSDPSLVPFDATFPVVDALRSKLAYTGYIAEPRPAAAASDGPSVGQDEVVVSAGGGRVGERLLGTALTACTRSRIAPHRWRILVGHELEAVRFDRLRESAPRGVVVERNRTDFATLLDHCRVSVSQAGYNTVVDVLRARARAIVVPFAGNQEQEQGLRAERFAARGLVSVLPDGSLSPESLAREVDEVGNRERPPADAVDLGGLNRTVELILEQAR